MKSDGVEDIFTQLKDKCKEEKIKVQIAEKEYEEAKRTYHFEDEQCLIDSAERNVEIAKARLNAFIETKISTEKYMKKLRHKEKREPYSQQAHGMKCEYDEIKQLY